MTAYASQPGFLGIPGSQLTWTGWEQVTPEPGSYWAGAVDLVIPGQGVVSLTRDDLTHAIDTLCWARRTAYPVTPFPDLDRGAKP